MENKISYKNFSWTFSLWTGVGVALILALVVAVLTGSNIDRERGFMSKVLSEKGAALILAVEAGTRTGMRGHFGSTVRIQTLLEETARQPNILFVAVTDQHGRDLADSRPELIGTSFLDPAQMAELNPGLEEKWTVVEDPDGRRAFMVYREFRPMPILSGHSEMGMMPGMRGSDGIGMGRGHGRGGPGRGHDESVAGEVRPDRFEDKFFHVDQLDSQGRPINLEEMKVTIFLGMDIEPFEKARSAMIRRTLLLAGTLFLLGLAGVAVLVWAQRLRRSQRLLRDSRAFAAEVVSSLPVGLVVIDPKGKVAMMNGVAEGLTGLGAVESKGGDPGDMLPPEFMSQVVRANAGHRVREREIECRFGGRTLPIGVSAARIETDQGEFAGNLVIMRDLREVRRLQEEIRRKEKLAAIGNLAAGVAHEIRNPLSSIKGFATYFGTRFEEGSEDRKSAQVMVHEVERLNKVISELIELARPSDMQPVPTDVEMILDHSLRLVRQDLTAAGIELELDVQSGLEEITLDPDRLTQALLNLYINAIQAMESGGRLKVSAKPIKSGGLELRISDTGHGVSSQDRARIFDPYYTTKGQGTGLGLAVVQKVMEAHGGEVEVESELEMGTTFILRFPTMNAEVADES